MRAPSLFMALLITTIAAAIDFAEAAGHSGRGLANSARGQAPTLAYPATPTQAPMKRVTVNVDKDREISSCIFV